MLHWADFTGRLAVPSEDYSHGRALLRGINCEGRQTEDEQQSAKQTGLAKINSGNDGGTVHWRRKHCWQYFAVAHRLSLNWRKWLANGFGFSSRTSNRMKSLAFWLNLAFIGTTPAKPGSIRVDCSAINEPPLTRAGFMEVTSRLMRYWREVSLTVDGKKMPAVGFRPFFMSVKLTVKVRKNCEKVKQNRI